MRPRKYWGGESRRLTMMIWCRVKMGSDSWFSIFEFLAILFLWFMLSDSAKSDVIVYVDYVDILVEPETPAEAVDIGWDLSGKDAPLGFLYFAQPEETAPFGPYFEFGSWSDMTGFAGVQRLAFYLGNDGFVQTARFGDRLVRTEGMMAGSGFVSRGIQIPNDEYLYIPFLWDSYADQFMNTEIDTYYGGSGWISLSAAMQDAPEGQNPYFIVDSIAISHGEIYAGQTSLQAVPEPTTWAVCAVLILMCFKLRRNYNARA